MLLSEFDRSSRQEISRIYLNSTTPPIKWIEWTCIDYFNQQQQYTHASQNSHGTLININHILGHKTHSSKFKIIEPIQCLLLEHNEIRVEINTREVTEKSQSVWKLNKTLLNSM